MAILTGEYKNNLDEKGRVSFPAKLRSSLGEATVMITRGVDKCLWVFPQDAWDAFLQKVMSQASLFQASLVRCCVAWLLPPRKLKLTSKAGFQFLKVCANTRAWKKSALFWGFPSIWKFGALTVMKIIYRRVKLIS